MSERARLRRILRLQRVSEVRRDAAESALARAEAEEDEARRAVAAAEQLAQAGAERFAGIEAIAVAEMADAHAYVRALQHHVAWAREQASEAHAQTQARRGDAADAHREVRKMEIWGESAAERQRLEENRVEQRNNDELAARLKTGRKA